MDGNPYAPGKWLVARVGFRDGSCPLAEIWKGEVYQVHSWIISDGCPGVLLEGLTKTRAFPIYLFAPLKQGLDPREWFKKEIRKYEQEGD